MPSRKERAASKLTELTFARDEAERKAQRARQKLYAGMLKAHPALTYREIATITGLSEIRVAQILRAEREAS